MKFYPKYGSVMGKLKSSDTFPQSPIIRRQLVGEVPTNTMDYPDLDQAFVKVCITLLVKLRQPNIMYTSFIQMSQEVKRCRN